MQRNTRMATLPSGMCTTDMDHKARYATMKRQETVKKHHHKNAKDLDVLLPSKSVCYMHWRGVTTKWRPGKIETK